MNRATSRDSSAPAAFMFLCCCGLLAFAPRPSAELRKADHLHATGKRDEAVATYKQYPSFLLAGSRRARLGRRGVAGYHLAHDPGPAAGNRELRIMGSGDVTIL